MLYRITTYKTSGAFDSFDLWRNVYTYESEADILVMRLFTSDVMKSETELHCSHVRFMFGTVNMIGADNIEQYGKDGTELPATLANSAVALAYDGWQFGRLDSSDACGPEMVLIVNRNVTHGRGGKLWYRGALRERDLHKSSGTYVALKTSDLWNVQFQDKFVYPLGNDVSKWKVEQRHTAETGAKGFVDVTSFTANDVLRDRTRRRARRRVPDARKSTLIALWQYIDVARREYDYFIRDLNGIGPFWQQVTKQHILDCLSACLAVSIICQNAIHTKVDGTVDQDLTLVTRFGPTCADLYSGAGVTAEWSDGSAHPSEGYVTAVNQISQTQPEHFIIADLYFTEEQLQSWKESADKFFNASQMLLRGDYLISTPPPIT